MKNFFKKYKEMVIISFLPLFASAQFQGSEAERFAGTKKILLGIKSIIATLIPIAFSLAVLFFFWGVAKFIFASGNGKDEGKKIMVWGVVAIFVMSSVWGIVAFISGTFGIDPATNATIPTIK